MERLALKRKVAIVGCGFVGSACAFSLMESKLFSEMVLVDVDRNRAEGEALDISHGVPFYGSMKIYAGDYSDVTDANVVVVTAGVAQKPGETRLDLIQRNAAIFKSIIPQIATPQFNGVLLIVSNPVDVLADIAMRLSGLPKHRVLGSGTALDTARLKYALGRELDVDPRHVHARIVGEHGDSELVLWSTANIAGTPIADVFASRGVENATQVMDAVAAEVRNSAYEIIEKKRATYFGIAASVRRIASAIVCDEKSLLTVSNRAGHLYGMEDVVMSMPAVVGFDGIGYQVPVPLSESEHDHLARSAAALKETLNSVDLS